MNIIDPRLRKTVVIDGAAFTLRPLNGADRLAIGAAKDGERIAEIVRRGVVEAKGTPLPWGVIGTDDLDVPTLVKLANDITEFSGIGDADRKNSPSGAASSSDDSVTPAKNVTSTSTVNA